MGKYMRKCRGAAGNKAPTVELRAQVVLGVRTRSRSTTATLAAVARATAPKRRKTTTTARVQEEGLGRDDGAVGCYLHLRSRRLFMAAAAVVAAPRGPGAEEAPSAAAAALADSGASGEAVVAGISRCSSTASSVDMEARERSGGAAEACEDRDVESSVSDSGSGREWRETTPSSRPPGDLSDLESSQGADEQKHHRRRCPATTTTSATFHAAARARMPPAAEIEEFFAAAEKAEAERFAAKYNFDVVRGVPINAGRFEWTPVASG